MARKIFAAGVLICLGLVCVGHAQTTLYFDPTYTAGSNNGTQAHPYATWATLWTAINSALTTGGASVPVNVFLSSDVTDTNEMNLSSCTATACKSPNSTITCSGFGESFVCAISGTYVLFDGISEQNIGSNTVPNWVATGVPLNSCIEPMPGATNPPTYVCPQNTALRYTIQTSVPVTGPTGGSAPNNCVYNIDIRGMSFQGTSGQSANLTYVGYLILEDSEVTRIALGSGGPGMYIGPGQSGPCHTGAARPGGTDSGPDWVVPQFNIVHDEWGETIYDGASTSDPFVANASCTACQQFEAGTSGTNLACGNGCASNSTVCSTPGTPATCSTGAHHRIVSNTIFGSAAWGGQGDGMDIKDGHDDLMILNNRVYTGRYPNCAPGSCTNLYCSGGTNPGTACTSNAQCTGGGQCSAGSDGRCILMESASVVDSNFVQGCGHDGIDVVDSWNNSVGRSAVRVSNNIDVNINSKVGNNNAIELEPLNTTGLAQWGTVQFLNNSVFSVAATGITLSSGSYNVSALVSGNIVHSANTGISAGGASVDHNDCFSSGGTCTGTGTITSNPLFVSTSAPFVDTNFGVQPGSPVIGAGANNSAFFTNDYFGNTRTVPWWIGATQSASFVPAPATVSFAGLRFPRYVVIEEPDFLWKGDHTLQ